MSLIERLGIVNWDFSDKLKSVESDIAHLEANVLMTEQRRNERCLFDRLTALQYSYLLGLVNKIPDLYCPLIANVRAVYGPHCRGNKRQSDLVNVTWNLEVEVVACWAVVIGDVSAQSSLGLFDIDGNDPSEMTDESQRISTRMFLSALRRDAESIARDMALLTKARTSKAARDRLYGSMIKAVVCDGDRDAIRSFLATWKKKYFNPVAPYHRFSYHATVLCHLYGITIDDPDLGLHIIDVPEAVKARARAAVATLDVKV